MLIDTHCHIHSADYPLDREAVLARAQKAGVGQIICVSTGVEDEKLVQVFASAHPGQVFYRGPEIGLDYHYEQNREQQISALRAHIEAHQDETLIFHVREAYPDFLRILADYPHIKATVHSYSGTPADTEQILSSNHNIYFGISALAIFARITLPPLEKLVLETDAPYLTPPPYRGKINEPAYVLEIAKWVADQTNTSLEKVSEITTNNAKQLFNI